LTLCSVAKRKYYGSFNIIRSVVGRHVNEIMVLHLLKSYCLPRLMYGCEIWPLNAVIVYAKLMFYGIMVIGMFLTVVGRKVLSHFSFIVTACRCLINYMKDSCCFIDDYCCSDNIVLRTVAGLPIRFEMLGILQLTMMLMTYITQLKRSRMPCMLLSFVNNIRF